MTFASLSFLYYFLPVVVGVSCLLPRGKSNAARNWFLLGASLFFCFWSHWAMFSLPFVCVFGMQAVAYLVGVIRKKFRPRKNPVYLALYLLGTPWAVGPMLPYPDLEQQMRERTCTVPKFAAGLRRLILGLCKKVILADTLWAFTQAVDTFGETTGLLGWVRLAAMVLAVYYDLSGYADMAVGLGRLLGFELCGLAPALLLWLESLGGKQKLEKHRTAWLGVIWVILLVGGVIDTSGGWPNVMALVTPLLGGMPALPGEGGLYLLKSYAIPFVLALLGVTPWPARWAEKLRRGKHTARGFAVLEPVVLALLLLLGTAWLVSTGEVPF